MGFRGKERGVQGEGEGGLVGRRDGLKGEGERV